LAEEAEALRIEIGALKERDEKREAEFKKLQSQVAALTPVKEKA